MIHLNCENFTHIDTTEIVFCHVFVIVCYQKSFSPTSKLTIMSLLEIGSTVVDIDIALSIQWKMCIFEKMNKIQSKCKKMWWQYLLCVISYFKNVSFCERKNGACLSQIYLYDWIGFIYKWYTQCNVFAVSRKMWVNLRHRFRFEREKRQTQAEENSCTDTCASQTKWNKLVDLLCV